MPQPKSVAVVGASGIGQHHANWWDTEGARVCAFIGTSSESVARTRRTLEEMFGFDGRGYQSLPDMLDNEHPDVIDVCSPPSYHYDHAKVAISAGCDVLCEKPFVHEDNVPPDELLDQARTIVAEARTAGVRIGMCSQYYVSAAACRDFLGEHGTQGTIKTFRGHIASPAAGRGPDPAATWVDLAPHMLAGIQALFPDGRVDFSSLSTRFAGHDARASFSLQLPGDDTIECEVITGRTTGQSEASHVRRYELNEQVFDIAGTRDENGIYCAEYHTPWGAYRRPDPMRLLHREFLAGKPCIDGIAALTNLSWLLRIKSHATT